MSRLGTRGRLSHLELPQQDANKPRTLPLHGLLEPLYGLHKLLYGLPGAAGQVRAAGRGQGAAGRGQDVLVG